ncbi:MAG: hypothetical protein OXB84_07570, partial [Halobacteriovoraceae bacterium]|nr:hypothetical protein [Halobacteriovoraceae bacterium]
NPYFLSSQVIPKSIKKIIFKKYQHIFDKYGKKAERLHTMINFMNQKDQSEYLPLFKDYVNTLDKIRGTSFAKSFPEFSELLSRY